MDSASIIVDEELYEMANLEPTKTGVDGFVYVSTSVPQHTPRLKYFKKLGRNQPSFSVLTADAPEVIVSSLSETETARYAPQVIEFVHRNQARLLDFGRNGTDWPSDQVHAFLQ